MRSTFLTWTFVVVVALAAAPAWAQTTSYIEYVGTGATGDYNTASNWNHLVQEGGTTGNWILASPPDPSVPANAPPSGNEEVAFIRNGATVTVRNTEPVVASIQIGVAGDVTKDSGGTILARPGSKLELYSGGVINLASVGGIGFPTLKNGTVGANYNGTLNVKGGQLSAYCNLFIGASGGTNPGGVVPYQGTGYLNVSSGNFLVGWNGSFLYIGSGRQSDTLGNRTRGIATFSGGAVSTMTGSGIIVGNNGGVGSLTVSQPDPNNATTVDNQGYLSIGISGNSTYSASGRYYRERSQGTYVQNAGNVQVGGLVVGASHADGLFTLNGGSFIIYGENECRVGVGGGLSAPMGTGASCTGNGSLIVNAGYFQANNSRTKFIVGRGNRDDGGVYSGGGTGVFLINGGYVSFNRSGDVRDSSIELGHTGDPWSQITNSYGELNVQGGSLYVNKQIMLAKNESATGVLRVSKNAWVQLGWLACWDPGQPPPATGVPIIIVDVTKTGHSVINVYQDLWLRGRLDVKTYGWRPKEGDKYMVIDLSSYESTIDGDFDVVTSEITNGLPTSPSDPNVTLSAFYGTGIPSDPSYGEPNAGYWVTFRGYTAGDANKDHMVDGGDLSLMGGAWMKSGQNWAHADFTGDGLVDGGDLALMGGNWMWSLPPAPEAPLPEPTTLALLALGAAAVIRRRKV